MPLEQDGNECLQIPERDALAPEKENTARSSRVRDPSDDDELNDSFVITVFKELDRRNSIELNSVSNHRSRRSTMPAKMANMIYEAHATARKNKPSTSRRASTQKVRASAKGGPRFSLKMDKKQETHRGKPFLAYELMNFAHEAQHSSRRMMFIDFDDVEDAFEGGIRAGHMPAVSFGQFHLLSMSPSTIIEAAHDPWILLDHGSKQLDPFIMDGSAEVMYNFPPPLKGDGLSPKNQSDDLSPGVLSSFCFPYGVSVRLVPRSILDTVRMKGWAGPEADKYQLKAFTNGRGDITHGICISTQELFKGVSEEETQKLVECLQGRLRMRRVAKRLCQLWRQRAQERGKQREEKSSMAPDRRGPLTGWWLSGRQQDLGRPSRNDAGLPLIIDDRDAMIVGFPPTNRKTALKLDAVKSNGQVNDFTCKSEDGSVTNRQLPKSGFSFSFGAKRWNNPSATAKRCKSAGDDPSGTKIGFDNAHSKLELAPSSDSNDDQSECKTEASEPSCSLDGCSIIMPTVSEDEELLAPVEEKKDDDEVNKDTSGSLVQTKEYPEHVQRAAKEAFAAMQEADSLGYVVIVEECFVLTDVQDGQQAILFCALQQIINHEREARSKEGYHIKSTIAEDDRKRLFEHMQKHLRLTYKHSKINELENLNKYDAVRNKERYAFRFELPAQGLKPILVPLPLPNVTAEWGLGRFLLTIKQKALIQLMKLLLLESSVLVIGQRPDEVTCCTSAILELLKPFKWAGAFIPFIRSDMLEFVTAPVPFISGMTTENVEAIEVVKSNPFVQDAMKYGLSIVDLYNGKLHITSSPDIRELVEDPCDTCDATRNEDDGSTSSSSLSAPHGLLAADYELEQFQSRIDDLAGRNPRSTLHCFKSFVHRGFSPRERLTIRAIRNTIRQKLEILMCVPFNDRSQWEQFGEINTSTNEFDFDEEAFLNPARRHLQWQIKFRERVVKTQLFLGYVDQQCRRTRHRRELLRGMEAMVIAYWVGRKWKEYKEKMSSSHDSFDSYDIDESKVIVL